MLQETLYKKQDIIFIIFCNLSDLKHCVKEATDKLLFCALSDKEQYCDQCQYYKNI